MKRYSISNIYIDYDGIQCECYLSKNRIKKVVYNFIYGLGSEYLCAMSSHSIQVSVYWYYVWDEPVIIIPMFDSWNGIMHGLGKDLGW